MALLGAVKSAKVNDQLVVLLEKVLSFGMPGELVFVQCVLKASKQLPANLKKEISGFIWHNFLIQMVKVSLFEENIVYQSFLVAPFTEVTFLLREKVVIRNAPASRCLLSFEASKQNAGKSKKRDLWFHLAQFRDSNGKSIFI